MNAAPFDRCVVRRVIKAGPDEVFRAWTSEEFARRWNWGRKYETLTVSIECRHGGVWSQQVRDRETGEVWTFRGEFREVRVPSRLVHTFHWTSDRGTDEGESLVEIDFVRAKGGTEVIITHSELRSEKQHDGTVNGWAEILKCIEECFA
jgi:uncharacterized protein YndB with AHSA1/START domain